MDPGSITTLSYFAGKAEVSPRIAVVPRKQPRRPYAGLMLPASIANLDPGDPSAPKWAVRLVTIS